jgi:hypothetical protein
LTFNTLSETNNNQFSIERSADGLSFDNIGTIQGAGNSSELKTYTFIDAKPISGTNYYRIMQTDYDGISTYSEIKTAQNKVSSLVLTPRSTYDMIDISTEMTFYDVNVFNPAGTLVKSFDNLTGNQTIDVSALTAGVYLIRVTNGISKETFHITKL